MTKTEIQNRIRSIEIAAIGMGVPLNLGQRNAIARLRRQLAEAEYDEATERFGRNADGTLRGQGRRRGY